MSVRDFQERVLSWKPELALPLWAVQGQVPSRAPAASTHGRRGQSLQGFGRIMENPEQTDNVSDNRPNLQLVVRIQAQNAAGPVLKLKFNLLQPSS